MSKDSKVAAVTGSTGGLGQELCKRLALQGWDLVLINRSRDKAETQLESLRQISPGSVFRSYLVDLLDPEKIADVTRTIVGDESRLSALYNVAGLLTDRSTASPQGLEGHFVVNTLAPYLFTRGLRPLLASGAESDHPSVVVNFSSSAIKGVKKLDLDRLTDPNNAGGLLGAYAQSKMALTITTAVMSGELADDGIMALSVDPGATRTSMTSGADGMPWFLRLIVPFLFKSAEAQAAKLLDGVTYAAREKAWGAFVVEGKRKPMPALASDEALQAKIRTLLEDVAKPYLASNV